jgi:glycosyltransferase involved in cell wall biosynthesis
MRCSRLAYVSFDTVPAPKGAATHIQAFARTLAGAFGGIELVTVGAGADACLKEERWPGVFHTELPALGDTLIDRVLCFRRFFANWLWNRQFEAIQFRSIFEGLPLVELAGSSRLIFEVNGLPSIELKYRYPGVEDDWELQRKVEAQEKACLDAAHVVITPSGVTRQYLISARGVAAEKVKVIANGVDAGMFPPVELREPETHRALRLLYFGTLSAWQGVELGIRALAQVRQLVPAEFTVIGPGSGPERGALLTLAARLGVADYVRVLPAMPQAALMEHLVASDIVLAPLTLNDRNLVQGCCPLKILESMAAGVVVIASDLPVVRELGSDGVHFLLVKPGSVDQIAEAVLRIAADRSLANRIADQGRAHVLAHHTWECSGEALVHVYEELGINRASNA